jgi:hypothetical protein
MHVTLKCKYFKKEIIFKWNSENRYLIDKICSTGCECSKTTN